MIPAGPPARIDALTRPRHGCCRHRAAYHQSRRRAQPGPARDRRAESIAEPGEDGAALLNARHHLLLNLFGVNPRALSPVTGFALGRALDRLEVVARYAAAGGPGSELPASHGEVQLRTEHRLSGDGEVALYRLGDGSSQLTLRTHHDRTSGVLVATLEFHAEDGTAVHGTLTHQPGLADGVPAAPAPHLVADYLASPPGAHGELDDFADAVAGPGHPAGSAEGLGSFARGALLGDLAGNDSWSAAAGQTALGVVPVAGQLADLRDIVAASGDVFRGEPGAWAGLGIAAIAVIPGLDFLKGGSRAGRKALAGAADDGVSATARAGLKRAGKRISKAAAARATRELRSLAVARAELLVRWRLLFDDQALSLGARANLGRARNALQDHLKPDDLAGALRDNLGIPVRRSGRGTAWNHAREVGQGLESLAKARDALLRDLSRMTPGTDTYRVLSRAMDESGELSRRVQSFLEIR